MGGWRDTKGRGQGHCRDVDEREGDGDEKGLMGMESDKTVRKTREIETGCT